MSSLYWSWPHFQYPKLNQGRYFIPTVNIHVIRNQHCLMKPKTRYNFTPVIPGDRDVFDMPLKPSRLQNYSTLPLSYSTRLLIIASWFPSFGFSTTSPKRTNKIWRRRGFQKLLDLERKRRVRMCNLQSAKDCASVNVTGDSTCPSCVQSQRQNKKKT